MICKNCGAKISESELMCPYCGTENFDVAKEQQENYVNQYEQKRKELKNVPKKVMKKVTTKILYVACCIIGIFALLIIVIMAFSRITAGDSLVKQQEEIAKLEEYYQSGDYEKMCDYLESIDKRGGSYEKYTRIYQLYVSVDWKIEAVINSVEYSEPDVIYVEECLEWCLGELATIDKMESLDFPYGEREGALYIKERYMSALEEYLLLTEDEINTAVSDYSENGNDYMELAEIAVQRVEENSR